MVSKAKWFVVRKPSTGEINYYISQSDCAAEIPRRYMYKMLYYIHQTPLSSWIVEGGSGDGTD